MQLPCSISKCLPALCVFLWLSVLPSSAFAQESANPFELEPRLEKPLRPEAADTAAADTVGEAPPANPFDIVSQPAAPEAQPVVLLPKPPTTPAERYRRIKLFVILGILILLAFLVTVLRSFVRKSVSAFANENMMNQLYREQEGRGALPFWLLYLLFFVNAGVFVFFLMRHYEVAWMADRPLTLLSLCISALTAFFLLKHLLLAFLAYVFPIEKEISRYTFTMVISGIVIGLLLVPANIFLAYADPKLIPHIIQVTLGAIALVYGIRYLRGLLIANRLLLFHKFHFLLYICTVEIAPVLFLLKLALNYL